jgi:4-hydroxybenzoate polyprenyltransferase
MESILHKFSRIYASLRIVSLDIVFGVVCGAYFATRIFDTSPSIYFWITLVSAVWVIYTADHILDGIRTKNKFTCKTYEFHFTHRVILIWIVIIIAVLSFVCVCFFLEKELIVYGISTSILVVIYLFLNSISQEKRRFFPKELIIGTLYTWGIFGGVILLKGDISFFQGLVIVNYFLLVFGNVLLFSYFDFEEDKINHFNTLAVNFGKKLTRRLVFVVLAIALLISLYIGFWRAKWIVPIIFGFMNLTLLLIIIFPSYFKTNGFYGMVADAIFFYPSLIFLFDSF